MHNIEVNETRKQKTQQHSAFFGVNKKKQTPIQFGINIRIKIFKEIKKSIFCIPQITYSSSHKTKK